MNKQSLKQQAGGFLAPSRPVSGPAHCYRPHRENTLGWQCS